MYFPRLRECRKKNRLSQEAVASLLGIQQTVYSRYERGFQTIPVEHLIHLAELYGTSTDDLLGRSENEE